MNTQINEMDTLLEGVQTIELLGRYLDDFWNDDFSIWKKNPK